MFSKFVTILFTVLNGAAVVCAQKIGTYNIFLTTTYSLVNGINGATSILDNFSLLQVQMSGASFTYPSGQNYILSSACTCTISGTCMSTTTAQSFIAYTYNGGVTKMVLINFLISGAQLYVNVGSTTGYTSGNI